MRVPPRVFAVSLFVAVGMLALVVAGMLDWIVGVLFLTMEFLGEFVRSVFRRRGERRHPPSRSRHPSVVSPHASDLQGGKARRAGRPRRKRAWRRPREATPDSPPDRRLRILVPVGGDERGLIDFALEECLGRRAEMILLFLRPMAVTPMGPTPLPGLAEDAEARATFDRIEAEAGRVGVALRTIYATTADLPATIGEHARACEADVVLVGSRKASRFLRFLSKDPTPSLLRRLPSRASLTIHAS